MSHPHAKARKSRSPQRRRAAVAKIARGSLAAAGLAFAQFAAPEQDPRFQVFNPSLVDCLHEPISRHHE